MSLVKPYQHRQPSLFPVSRNHSLRSSMPGAHEGLWQVYLGFPGSDLWGVGAVGLCKPEFQAQHCYWELSDNTATRARATIG